MRARWRDSDRLAAMVLAAPAVALLVGIALFPLVAVVGLALRRRLPIFGIDQFVGLANYRFLLGDARFWNALGNTLYFALVAVVSEIVLGLALALLLQRAFPGRGLVRAAVLVPWAIPTVVSARLWGWLFAPGVGLIDYVLRRPDLDWLGAPRLALNAAIAVDVWKTTPFVTLLLLAGLQAIPEDLYRAARVDGAGTWRIFREITLPLLAPVIAIAALFRTLDALRVFDAVYVLTGGGPADTTETLSIYAYRVLFQTLQFGYGAAISLVTCALAALASLLYLAALSRAGVSR